MTGRTGYTAYDDSDAYDPAAHITETAEHFDELIGESKPTAGDIPSSGNWLGRLIMTEDTGDLYLCTGLPNTWEPLTPDSGWVTPTLSNGWSAVGGWSVQYRRRNGQVFFRGRVTGGSTGVAFTLPVGYRPLTQALFSGVDGGSATARAWIFINSTGGVQFVSGQQAQLDEVHYLADA